MDTARPDNKEAKWTDTTTHLPLWSEPDLDYYFTSAIGAIEDKVGWADVNYLIGCINIKEHWMAVAADMKKCKIYEFD
ncbi:Ulp1-like peptidase [Cucumis melo var. makuwa]|uniref:Ulp1-like peptidase n=1 Tax=Cucumis melo var. makuwa TaxID=1194695 RepID=A0A5A7VJM7_CUCMM|nr:Ulp1-like peptidase [Cucumis melo var. makuwa]